MIRATSALSIGVLLIIAISTVEAAAQSPARVTVIVDAFGRIPALEKDWGFAALVEYQGKRILFDTGNNSDNFEANARRMNVDLTRLDFVVISHRHGDHTDGLRYLLEVNPDVTIYVPGADEYFGGATPPVFFSRPDESLPADMRYFGGAVPKQVPHGTPWERAKFVRVDGSIEILPGVRLVRNLSPGPAFAETPELSLVLDTGPGQLLVVGCSHPGIERILESIAAKERPVHLVVGGLHLVTAADAEVDRLARTLRDEWKVGSVAPGHCTGEYAFGALREVFGERYVYAGVGSVIELP